MPIPEPGPNESQREFLQRCMNDETVQEEYPDEEQRAAVCFRQYKDQQTD